MLEPWFLRFQVQETVFCGFVQAGGVVILGVKVWVSKLKDIDAIPAPELSQFGQWMKKAWACIVWRDVSTTSSTCSSQEGKKSLPPPPPPLLQEQQQTHRRNDGINASRCSDKGPVCACPGKTRSGRTAVPGSMACTPGHPNVWQEVAGQSSASPKCHPQPRITGKTWSLWTTKEWTRQIRWFHFRSLRPL